MKNLVKFVLISFVTFLAIPGFAQEKDMVVATDQNLEVGEFDKYSSFTFAKHIEDVDNNTFFLENESIKSILRDEIRGELQALGYEYVESNGDQSEADLIVNFQVLKEDTEFIGWEGVESLTGFWGFNVIAQDRDLEDRTTYNLEKGTIIVHMADAGQGIVVWRGYASGIVEDTELSEGDEIKINEAIARIFDKYNYTASR